MKAGVCNLTCWCLLMFPYKGNIYCTGTESQAGCLLGQGQECPYLHLLINASLGLQRLIAKAWLRKSEAHVVPLCHAAEWCLTRQCCCFLGFRFPSSYGTRRGTIGKSEFIPQLLSHPPSLSHSEAKGNTVMIHGPHFLQVIIFPRWVMIYAGRVGKECQFSFLPLWPFCWQTAGNSVSPLGRPS